MKVTIPRPANDNKPLPSLEEYLYWSKKLLPNNNMRPQSHRQPDRATAEQSLRNFIWFFKFEYSFIKESIEDRRSQIKVVT